MDVHFTPELEAKLTQSAARQGRRPDEPVQEVITRYFDEGTRFVEAVKRGEDALHRGEHLTHEQVGERLQRFLRPGWNFVGRYRRRNAFAIGSSATTWKRRGELPNHLRGMRRVEGFSLPWTRQQPHGRTAETLVSTPALHFYRVSIKPPSCFPRAAAERFFVVRQPRSCFWFHKGSFLQCKGVL